MKPAAALLATLLLPACTASPPPAKPEDAILQRESAAGNLAFTLERPSEAAAQYEAALQRAEARDDAAAIGDYGYDLAVAELAANQPKQALASARTTRTALVRRGAAAFPALILVEATALYRLGDLNEADSLAAEVEAGNDQSAAAGAAFLSGLIADETGDPSGLDAALAKLAHPQSLAQSADAFELAARRDLRDGRYETAASEAARAADIRRAGLDYRGMARALALQGAALAASGETTRAADLYIQAAQSAAAQGDPTAARPWLRRALALANTPALRQLARQTLASLPTAQDDPSQH
jgi:hypothetical protein